MTLPTYSTGTVSVSADGTVVTGLGGPIWSGTNVKEGDWIEIDGAPAVLILAVTDMTHLVIPPWQGSDKVSVPYVVYNNFSARDDGTAIARDVSTLVAALNKEGFIWFVGPDETDPDPSRGDEGQWAYQPSTGKQWHKEGGLWLYDGIFKGFGVPAPYDNGATYSLNDVATFGGSSYVWINATPGSGHAPPNETYWAVLASIGATGPTGATGPGYGGTSATSLTIGAGAKALTTQAGLAYTNGARVRATSSANTSNWMEGIATYSGTTLTINVDKTNGSGTISSWNLNVVGEPGAGDLSSANNLSDLASASSARVNLGLGTAAVHADTDFMRFGPPQGRLTLTPDTPVMTSSASGQTTIRYTPAVGDMVPLYDGVNFIPTVFSELSQLTTDATKSPAAVTANSNYDLFVWNDSGTIRCTRGPAWSSGTSRGTGAGTTELTRVKGLLLNANSITNGPAAQRGTYVGTVRSNGMSTIDWILGASGAGGTAAVLGVWNAYNRQTIATTVTDSNATWAYTSATVRQVGGSTGNQVRFVSGLAADGISASYFNRASVAAVNGAFYQIGIAMDSVTAFDKVNAYQNNAASAVSAGASVTNNYGPQIGFHYIAALERSDGTNSVTFVGGTGIGLCVQVMA